MGIMDRARAACSKKSAGCAEDSASDASDQSTVELQEFPSEQRFWRGGDDYVLLGSGIRYYCITSFIKLKVYALALYVERGPALAELARLRSQGFFADGDTGTERMCAAAAALNCTKVAQIQLLRSITGPQFTEALSKALQPRLAGTEAAKLIPGLEQHFEAKQLTYHSNVPLMWTADGRLEAQLLPPGAADFAAVKPDYAVQSAPFAAAVFDIYLAPDTPVTGAREQWAATLRQMLASLPSAA